MNTVTALFLTTSMTVNAAEVDSSPSALGYWLSEDADAVIEVSLQDAELVGHIVWLAEPTHEDGSAKRDLANPDTALRDREIVGLRLLWGFRGSPDDPDTFARGRVYDPANGKTYKCKAAYDADGDVLKIRGYVGTPLFGRTTEWARVTTEEMLGLSTGDEAESPACKAGSR